MRFSNFEVTKREILISISIISILLILGTILSEKIEKSIFDKNEKYDKAVKIENQELFEYSMKTGVGNAFVYGELKAKNTVTYPGIDGEYMKIEKVKEIYTMHTRQVSHTRTINGHTTTYYTTEVYWTWDFSNKESRTCKEISFLNHVFESKKIRIPECIHIETIYESNRVRYQYYATESNLKGTIFTKLSENTISDDSDFYKNKNIKETIEKIESNFPLSAFWMFWIIMMILIVYVFLYADNKWLR